MDNLQHLLASPAAPDDEVVDPAQARLAIVDDSRLRRDCLRLALAGHPRRWHIEAAAAAAEIDCSRRNGFDAILFGASNCAAIDLADVARLASVAPLLVCADCEDPLHMRAILGAGARGFVPASLGLGALLAALERVRAGATYVPAPLRAAPRAATGAARGELTRRQREVLALITEGRSNRSIADALAMSEDTVKVHVKQIIRRLNVANRTQAALLAARAAGPLAPRQVARR